MRKNLGLKKVRMKPVSQICALILIFSFTEIDFVANSTPTVVLLSKENSSCVNLLNKFVFPTAESPSKFFNKNFIAK